MNVFSIYFRVPGSLLAACLALTIPTSAQQVSTRTVSDLGPVPWGISSSASSTGNSKEWLPEVSSAGVRWARMFPEWSTLQKQNGQFDFTPGDKLVDNAKEAQVEISGLIFGNAPGAAGGIHAFPIAHLGQWSDYTSALVAHYKGQIHYWEVWNEGNGGFNDAHNVTGDYANLVTSAYVGAKKADPDIKVGMSVASFDPAYVDQAIVDQAKAGSPGSFDYICIHPYETFGGIGDVDGEVPYLWMARMLRDELKADAPAGKVDVPIWITEIGRPVERNTNEVGVALGQDVHEVDAARAMVKAYVMAVAQGIARICWFEAQDPPNEPPGYGLLRRDGSKRPSFVAIKAMIDALGEKPKFLGWVALGAGERAYGFVFKGESAPVMVLWMPAGMTDNTITFKGDVKIIDAVTGESNPLRAGKPLTLTNSPVLVLGIPSDLVSLASTNKSKNFPWGGDYSEAKVASLQLGPQLVSKGVALQGGTKPAHTFPDNSTGVEVQGTIGSAANFYTHPSFASIRNKEYYIRMTFRRIGAGNVGMNFKYEVADSQGQGPLRNNGGWFALTDDPGWQTHVWHVTDACFAKMWGFDFSVNPEQSVPFVIGKVEVSTQPLE